MTKRALLIAAALLIPSALYASPGIFVSRSTTCSDVPSPVAFNTYCLPSSGSNAQKLLFWNGSAWAVAAAVIGPTGTQGQPGGGITIPYVFSTATADADPGNGNLRLNNATQNISTVIRADLLDPSLTSWVSVLDTLDASTSTVKGQIRLSKATDPTKWLMFDLTARASPSGYRNFAVTNTGSSAASPFSDGDVILFAFTRTGDKGADGASGTSGSSGVNGGAIAIVYHITDVEADVDPDDGNLAFDNFSIQRSSTILRADYVDAFLSSVSGTLGFMSESTSTLSLGQLRIVKQDDPSAWLLYNVTSISFQSGYANISVTNIDWTDSSPFVNGDTVVVEFTRTGDASTEAGPQGAPGSTSIRYIYGASSFFTSSRLTLVSASSTANLPAGGFSQSQAYYVLVSTTSFGGVNVSALLETFDDSTSTVKGQLRVVNEADETKWLTFTMTASATSNGAGGDCGACLYFVVTNTGASSSDPFTLGDTVLLQFTRTGDKGDTGATGADASLGGSPNLPDTGRKGSITADTTVSAGSSTVRSLACGDTAIGLNKIWNESGFLRNLTGTLSSSMPAGAVRQILFATYNDTLQGAGVGFALADASLIKTDTVGFLYLAKYAPAVIVTRSPAQTDLVHIATAAEFLSDSTPSQTVIGGAFGVTIGASTSRDAGPFCQAVSGTSPTDLNNAIAIPVDGTLSDLMVTQASGSTPTNPTVLTLRKNNADTTQTVSIGLSGPSFYEDRTHTTSVVAGDYIVPRATSGAGGTQPSLRTVRYTFASSSGNTSIIGGIINDTVSTTANFAQPHATARANQISASTAASAALGLPMDCDASKLYVIQQTANPSGVTTTFTLQKDGVDTAITGTITDATTITAPVAVDVTHTASFTKGQAMTLKHQTDTGTSGTIGSWSMACD